MRPTSAKRSGGDSPNLRSSAPRSPALPAPADQPASPVRPFEQDLLAGLGELRSSLRDAVSAAGSPTDRAQQLGRALGLDKSLAWKIVRILSVDEPLLAVQHLPGEHGLTILLKALAKHGAPKSAVERLAAALRTIDELTRIHCGDRLTLELMAGEMYPLALQRERIDVARRSAFLGASAIWGLQARARIASNFVAPSADAGRLDLCGTNALVDLRRLRPNASWPLFISQLHDDKGKPLSYGRPEPILTSAGADASPLLREFCSERSAAVEPIALPTGTRWELQAGPVGHSFATTVVFGEIYRSLASPYRDDRNRYAQHLMRHFTPSEVLHADVFVHRDLPFAMPPEAILYGRLLDFVDHAMDVRERDRLPLPEAAEPLPTRPDGSPDASCPEHARQQELTDLVMRRLGWSPSDFRGYRLTMRYPPIPTALLLRYPLLERPG